MEMEQRQRSKKCRNSLTLTFIHFVLVLMMKFPRVSRNKLRFPIPCALVLLQMIGFCHGCEFYPIGEYLRFVRIPENLRIGERVMSIEVHNKQNLRLESVERTEDAKYFKLSERSNPKMIDILLAKSLENVIDHESPQNILKFRLVCFPEDKETAPNFLSITIFVEDVNNHAPKFLHAPYYITVDELTPIGLTVFRGITALDLDKPNTPNSEINYSIIGGNKDGKFGLESSQRPGLIVKKNLDYDSGDHEFQLVISASDRGSPPLSSNTTLYITVKDNDDLPVVFKKNLYRTHIKEFYPITNETIHVELKFQPSPISAYDQDISINASVQYEIISGNELGYFQINQTNGKLYLIRQVDRELLPSDAFELQIRAKQNNNHGKYGFAKVVVDVLDLNENMPEFEHGAYNISIMENLPNGFSVLQVHAEDRDQGENGEFIYKLDDRTKAFIIDPKTGWLTVRDETKLDREKIESIELKVYTEEKLANIAAGSGKRSQAIVTIGLLDANDNSPTFLPSNLFHFQVTMDSEIGSVVGKVTAQDADVESNGNGKIVYDIQKSNLSTNDADIPFEIDSKNGYIYLLERPLPKLQYTILVEASDQPSNPSERRYSLAVVQIDVVKAGVNHSPEFIGSPYEFWVGTAVGVGTSVGQVKVKDLDPKYTVYDLLHSYYEGVPFAIEERTGIIAVVDELMKYPRHHYDFEAYVTDSRHTLTTNVSIHIVDPIDVHTASASEPIELSVKENLGGAIVGNLKKILNQNGRMMEKGMEFLLANYDARDKFAISNDGNVYTLKGLDREEKERYLLTVIASSRGVLPGQGVYQISVRVLDENDNKPQFDRPSYEAHVRENSDPGTPVLMEHPVRVVDIDEGVNGKFQLQLKGEGANKFRIDPLSGKIYVGNLPLDREEKSTYSLAIVGTDTGNLSSTAPILIHIDDLNDNPPRFNPKIVLDPPDFIESINNGNGARDLLRASASDTSTSQVEISTSEPIRIPETVEVGTKIARVQASDKDLSENAVVFYRIVSENSNSIGGKLGFLTDKQYLFARNKDKHFNIDRGSGEISVGKTLKPDTEYALNISASDRGGLRTYTGVRVIVFDVNNFQPMFTKTWYTFEVMEGRYEGKEIGKVIATDGDSGVNGEISYKLQWKEGGNNVREKLPFSIDLKTGQIYVDGELDRERKDRYLLQAIAIDSGTPSMEGVVDVQIEILDVNDNRPIFHDYMSTSQVGGEIIPIYRTSLYDNVPVGTVVTVVYANDSDSLSNGNGLVLLHLNNHHREFYIDSKNGTITTVGRLDEDRPRISEYNLTVFATDLGKPSLSSRAWVLVRIMKTKEEAAVGIGNENETKVFPQSPRMFEKEIYVYQVPFNLPQVPTKLTKFNVTDKYKKFQNEFELYGEESVVSYFKIDKITGELLIVKKLEEGRVYEFLVRGHNPQMPPKNFDTRQWGLRKGSSVGDSYLGLNEALVRVRRMPLPVLPPPVTTLPPPPPKRTTTTKRPYINPTGEPNSDAAEPKIVTKGPPRIVLGKTPGHGFNISDTTGRHNNNNHINHILHQKTGNFYAGEIAVLTLSSVIFLGGLIAAIAVACVRKRRRHHHRTVRNLPPHISGLPMEVRLQKQRISSGPARPILFPMALPSPMIPNNGGEGSENTSDTYTDSGDVISHTKDSFALQNAGFSICPDCRKLKKPFRNNLLRESRMKHSRVQGGGGPSLQSSHDSGIDGSDGQCNCCHLLNNNISSDSSATREHFEDSLMMSQVAHGNIGPKSFRRKRSAHKHHFPNPNHNNRSSNNNLSKSTNNLNSSSSNHHQQPNPQNIIKHQHRLGDRMVML